MPHFAHLIVFVLSGNARRVALVDMPTLKEPVPERPLTSGIMQGVAAAAQAAGTATAGVDPVLYCIAGQLVPATRLHFSQR